MPYMSPICFPPFRLDPGDARLWHEARPLPLRPKAFAVLHYLLQHPGQLVTKEQLAKAVWSSTVVSETVLRVCLREIRRVLDDRATEPRFVETVPRRGYRFIGTILAEDQARPTGHWPGAATLVGRAEELTRLHHLLEQARAGARQLVFVTGEPGIGKTALVEAFVAEIERQPHLWTAYGQCIEHYGEGEPYLPLLEALERLGHRPGHARLLPLLRRYAPLWLTQLPAFLTPEDRRALQQETAGATQGRMQREMATLLEALTEQGAGEASPLLVLWLEDLHWSDAATLDLLAALARRREPARLLIVGTYRPAEALASGHPLGAVHRELHGHGLCTELPLGWLSEAAVVEYVRRCFTINEARPASLQRMAQALYRRTGGHPLFLTALVEELISGGAMTPGKGDGVFAHELTTGGGGVPERLRQLVAQQMERLPPADQRVLAAASVAGVTFSAGAVAAAVPMDTEKAEGRFAHLAQRQQFVRPAGFSIWPDGTETARYAFRHAVYQELWHEHVLPPQRPTFHRRIGQRLEAAYGARATEVAAELAVHFEEGREYHRAVQYHAQATQTAIRRQASHEAIGHLRKALDLLQALPDTPERTEQEFGLQFSLRVQLGRLQGEAAPALEGIVARIRTLSEQVAPTPAHFWALASVYLFYLARQELPTARRLAEQHLHMAQGFADPLFAMAAQTELGIVNFFLGEFAAARMHFDYALARYDTRPPLPFSVDWEHGSPCLGYAALTLWQLGYPDQAMQKSQEALGRAQGLGLPYMQAFALNLAALLYYFRGERDAVQERAATAMQLATTHGFAGMVEMGKIFGGWVLAHGGEKTHGIVQLQHGMQAYHATGGETFRPSYLALLAEACKEVGKIEDGLGAIDEALAVVHRTGGRYCEAQLYRLRGELLLSLATPNPGAAEACFQQALTTARGQQAKAWELQVGVSLSRLWQRQGKAAEARRVLAEIYQWFTEGFDTKDLQEAKALLRDLEEKVKWGSGETDKR